MSKRSGSFGFSIVEVLVAVGLLIIVMVGITHFLTNQARSTNVIVNSSQCQNAIQTIVDRFNTYGTRDVVLPPLVPAQNQAVRRVTSPPAHIDILDSWGSSDVIDTSSPPNINNAYMIVGTASILEALLNNNRSSGVCNKGIETSPITVANRGMAFDRLLPADHSLNDPHVWINIIPYNTASAQNTNCPSANVYARPKGDSAPPSGYTLTADPDLGYHLYITLEHSVSGSAQRHLCTAEAIYTHAHDSINNGTVARMNNIRNSTGNLANNPIGVFTSCDDRNVSLDLSLRDAELGSVLICRGLIIEPATAVATGTWASCDSMRFPAQTGTTNSSWNSSTQTISLTFQNLAGNRGYRLEYATVDTAGNIGPVNSSEFLVDTTRPSMYIAQQGNNIGLPEDSVAGRNPLPLPWSFQTGWGVTRLQCNANPVTFNGTPSDVLTSNLLGCTGSGMSMSGCSGTTASATHGSHTVTMSSSDACGTDGSASYSWTTVLSDSFNPQNLASTPVFDRERNKPSTDTDHFRIQVPSPINTGYNPSNLFVIACDCNPLVPGSLTCGTQRGGVTNACQAPAAGTYNFEFHAFDICGRKPATYPTPLHGNYEVRGDKDDNCNVIACRAADSLGAGNLACCQSNPTPTQLCTPNTCSVLPSSAPMCDAATPGYPSGADSGLYDCSTCLRTCNHSDVHGTSTATCPVTAALGAPCQFNARGSCDYASGLCVATPSCTEAWCKGPSTTTNCTVSGNNGLNCRFISNSDCGAVGGSCVARPWNDTASAPVCGTRQPGACGPGASVTPPPSPPTCPSGAFPTEAECTTSLNGSLSSYCEAQGTCFVAKSCPASSYYGTSNCMDNRTDPAFCLPTASNPLCYEVKTCQSLSLFDDIAPCEAKPGFDRLRDKCEGIAGTHCFGQTKRCPRRGELTVTAEGGTWLHERGAPALQVCMNYIKNRFHNEDTGSFGSFWRRQCSMNTRNRPITYTYDAMGVATEGVGSQAICFGYYATCGVHRACNRTDAWANMLGCQATIDGVPNCPSCNAECVDLYGDNGYTYCVSKPTDTCAPGPGDGNGDPLEEPPNGGNCDTCSAAGQCLNTTLCCPGRTNEHTICAATCTTQGNCLKNIPTGNTCNPCGPIVIDDPGCFAKNTLVTLASGEQLPIQDVQVGDTVLTFAAQSGSIEAKKVTEVFHHPARPTKFRKIYLSSGQVIRGTPDHVVWAQTDRGEGWYPLGELQSGHRMRLAINEQNTSAVEISKIEDSESIEEVFNLEVQDNHNYFVEDILVHNIKHPQEP